jgi:predicted adenine nucleotide alpha hydrolase (AANH) superfamily ATPase
MIGVIGCAARGLPFAAQLLARRASSYVLNALSGHLIFRYFTTTEHPAFEEFRKRADEHQKVSLDFPSARPARLLEALHEALSGAYRRAGERDRRAARACLACLRMRLRKTANTHGSGYDFFTTTLSVSAPKTRARSTKQAAASRKNTRFLLFPIQKKRTAIYVRIALSKEYGSTAGFLRECAYSQKRKGKLRIKRINPWIHINSVKNSGRHYSFAIFGPDFYFCGRRRAYFDSATISIKFGQARS